MRCFLGFHKWSKWLKVTYTVFNSRFGFRIGETYKKDYQERTCELCGKIDTEEI